MADKSSFGQWLRQRRKALGLTQKELAQRAGCAEISLRKIEAGDFQPSAALVASLARALGVADADLPRLHSLARGADDDFTARARLQRAQRPNNLPAQLTPLIGREHAIAAVRKRLLSDGARLITLLGPPGVGKTRLALAVAEEVLEQFEHGAFFVRLGSVSNPTLVAAVIAQALGMEMSGANPPALQLRAWLEEKHLLLVLDNFEQIVSAAPLVDDLLRRCPWLHILVTSRQPLRVRGERQVPVQPLTLPSALPNASQTTTAEDMLRYPAVALFADRAEAIQADFAVDDDNAAAVAELCRRLDGLPLAIELVAARVKLLPPADLLTRLHGPWLLSADGLRDVSERQRTLRGAIGWSYELLTPTEQTLFTRLSVFVGGCTLEAAEMMCEDVLSLRQVLDGIASLLDKSLLYRDVGLYGETRYAMLETVREYGWERITGSGEDATLRAQHVSCFLRLVEKAEHAGADPRHFRLRCLIDEDFHNVQTALGWAMEHDVRAALLLTSAIVGWYRQRGPLAEGKLLIEKVLALPGASVHTIPRAKVLFEAGILMLFNDEAGTGQIYEQESLALSRELSYGKGEADALLGLGRIALATSGLGVRQEAVQYLESALALYRQLDDPGGVCSVLVLLGEDALGRADYSRTRVLCEECLAVAQQAGFPFPWPLSTLGNIASGVEGNLERARSLHEQRLAIVRQREGLGSLAHVLMELGIVAIKQRDFTAARVFLDEAVVKAQELRGESDCQNVPLAMLCQAVGEFDSALQYYRESLRGADDLDWLWCPYFLGLASLAAALGQFLLTAKLCGVIEIVDATIIRLFPDEREELNRLGIAARASLGVATFEVVHALGREQEFTQMADEAISILETELHAQNQDFVLTKL